jgi:serine/threonine-protein kinase ATR
MSQQAMPAEHSDMIRSITVIFRQLFAMQGFSELKKTRIVAILAVRELLQHSTDQSVISLDTSALGQICLQSLQSKIREMRIAAGRTLPSFIQAPRWVGEEVNSLLKHNRATILTFLRTISEKDSPPLNETCILAWGQLGRVFDEAELSLVLLKLLEYLGHRNMITSACAFNELLNLAKYHGKTPKQLFDPCWKTLALSAVKDMVTRPQVTMRLADLLQMSVNELLLKLQQYALPWLVLGKRREIISKIADARGDDEPWMACLDSVNLPLILALLLCQDAPDVDSYVMSLFRFVSPYFDGLTLADLLQPETFSTTLELLKTSGEADEAQNTRVSGRYLLSTLIVRPLTIATDTASLGNHGRRTNGTHDEEAKERASARELYAAACAGSRYPF